MVKLSPLTASSFQRHLQQFAEPLLLAALVSTACHQVHDAVSSEAVGNLSLEASNNAEPAAIDNEEASVSDGQGKAALAAGRLAEAQRSYEHSLAIRTELVKQYPHSVKAKRKLAYTHGCLGEIAAKAGQLERAKWSYEQGLAIIENSLPPGAVLGAGSSVTLADVLYLEREQSLVALATVAIMAGQPAEAKRRSEQALAIDLEELKLVPQNSEVLERVEQLCARLGQLAVGAHEWAEAKRRYEQGLAVVEELLKQNPSSAQYQFRAADHHHVLGFVLGDEAHKRQAAAIVAAMGNGETLAPAQRQDFELLKRSVSEERAE